MAARESSEAWGALICDSFYGELPRLPVSEAKRKLRKDLVVRRAALTFLALAIVTLAVAPAQAKDGGKTKTFQVAVLQCKGNGAQLIVDAVSVTALDSEIEIGSMCGDALKALQDAGYATDSTISRPSTFTYTLTKKG